MKTTLRQLARSAVENNQRFFEAPEHLRCTLHPESLFQVTARRGSTRCAECYALDADRSNKQRGRRRPRHNEMLRVHPKRVKDDDTLIMTELWPIYKQAEMARKAGYLYFLPTVGMGCKRHLGATYRASDGRCRLCAEPSGHIIINRIEGRMHAESQEFKPPTLANYCSW